MCLVGVGTATTPLVIQLTRLITGNPRAARVAGFLMATYPPLVLLGGQPYSQTLALACFTGGVLCLVNVVKKGSFFHDIHQTEQPTTLAEHYIIADQCLKHGMKLVSLAPLRIKFQSS